MLRSPIRVIPRSTTLPILAIVLAFGVGCAAPVASQSHTSSRASSRSGGPSDPEVASFVRLMNAHRVSRGLRPLIWDSRVAAVARAHSRDMRERDYFSHTTPDGRTTWDRLKSRGVTYSQAGENIAWGHETGAEVLRGWLRSPGHRRNIQKGSYTHHGVGKVGTYWTHVFLRPRETNNDDDDDD